MYRKITSNTCTEKLLQIHVQKNYFKYMYRKITSNTTFWRWYYRVDGKIRVAGLSLIWWLVSQLLHLWDEYLLKQSPAIQVHKRYFYIFYMQSVAFFSKFQTEYLKQIPPLLFDLPVMKGHKSFLNYLNYHLILPGCQFIFQLNKANISAKLVIKFLIYIN